MAFAALGLLLAMTGIFGVLAFTVQQRTRELGVRIALGATPSNVLALVLQGMTALIGAGAIAGLVGAAILGRAVTSFLLGVEPLDPTTFAGVIVITAVTAALAVAVPAARAGRTDPLVAFKGE